MKFVGGRVRKGEPYRALTVIERETETVSMGKVYCDNLV
jgi:hypothetical protein